MARMKCPRCATIVDVAPGAAPACPNCGFGATAPPAAAPMAAPAPASPAPSWNASPQMSAPPMAGGPAVVRTSGKAIAALIVGICSLCIPYIGIVSSIVAIVLGILGMKEVDRSNGMVKGKGMAITGLVLGIVVLIIYILVFIFFGALLFAAAGDWDQIQECAEDPEAPGCEEYQAEAGDGPLESLRLRDAAMRLGAAAPLRGLAPATWSS